MTTTRETIDKAVLNRFRTLGLIPLGNLEGWHGVWCKPGPGGGPNATLVAVIRNHRHAITFAKKHWGASKNWTVTKLHAEDVHPGLFSKAGTVAAPTTRNARQPHRYCHWCREQGDHSDCKECDRLDSIDAELIEKGVKA